MIFPVRGATAVASANVVIAREFTSLALRGLITCDKKKLESNTLRMFVIK